MKPAPAPAATVFQQVLGADFFHLAPIVKQLHVQAGRSRWQGRTRIQRGGGLLARLCGWATGLPPASAEAATTVEFARDPGCETWTRRFDDARMVSTLRACNGLLCERLGAMEFHFRLFRIDDALHWRVQRARLFGLLPMPAGWFDEVHCREYAIDGVYHFEVQAAMPLAGPLVHYAGWLQPDVEAEPEPQA